MKNPLQKYWWRERERERRAHKIRGGLRLKPSDGISETRLLALQSKSNRFKEIIPAKASRIQFRRKDLQDENGAWKAQ